MTSVDEDFVRNLLEHMGDWFNDDEQFQLAPLFQFAIETVIIVP
jgi:hypothetical protein